MVSKINYLLTIILFLVISFNIYMALFFKEVRPPTFFNATIPETTTTQVIEHPPTKIITTCNFDYDCEWISTNCCPENAGAYWECINKKSYIDCLSRQILCPQVISPKPPLSCVCEKGSCVVK